MNRLLRAAWPLVMILSACAHVPPPPEKPVEEGAQGMSLSGRVSVHQEEKEFSAQFQWVSRGGEDEILLADPLGQGVARIVRNRLITTLQLPNGRKEAAPDADALTEKILGFRLPLAGMSYWVKARPNPGSPQQVIHSEDGQVERILQDGWKIDYLSYVEGRPRKMLITRPNLEIRLVVDHWGP